METLLGTLADTLFLKDAPIGEKVRNFFHGTWFGHPLHPAITDVPLGAWTAATALDVYELASGDETLTRGADFAVGIGLIGAAGAAITGLNDWNYTTKNRGELAHSTQSQTSRQRPATLARGGTGDTAVAVSP